MLKNVYEIFEEFEKAPSKNEKVDVLKNNYSPVLYAVLQFAFHPGIEFVVDKVPYYKPDDSPPGLGYSSIGQELERIYLFIKDHPRTPSGLTPERRDKILIQMLEALEAKEAIVLMNMIKKDLKIKGLTPKIVKEAFPGILPD
jgi:hypothetical protein